MVDIVITPANVVAGNTATIVRGTAGATITAGQWLYLDSTTGKYNLADTDSATSGVRSAIGVALNGASVDQPVSVCTAGPVTIGGAILAGVAYYLSGTPGGMAPVADVAAGDYPLIVGMGASTTVLNVGVVYPGVVLA